ncbi:uncharacterized protein LOC110058785 [Orbicella faveolata]|uniref:uncharacterized protein LOC110058785 n=1 Tax=Orbicella faveolata TaxID=48498 RepID=UPI0009E4581A|nr:uncharacterized protein LOC110058785 [Orbicella faveolata]
MGFSITSSVVGFLFVICYIVISSVHLIRVIGSILGIIEFVIGFWAASCVCVMKPCTCCYTPAQQASSGVPVAIRRQAGDGIDALQTLTLGALESQPQIVLLPPPPYEVVASAYQTLQVDMPPSYEEAARGD